MNHLNLIRHFHATLADPSELSGYRQEHFANEEVAHVDTPIHPGMTGRVRYHGTYWFGVCPENQVLPVGTEVIVTGRSGNTLLVKPVLTCAL